MEGVRVFQSEDKIMVELLEEYKMIPEVTVKEESKESEDDTSKATKPHTETSDNKKVLQVQLDEVLFFKTHHVTH